MGVITLLVTREWPRLLATGEVIGFAWLAGVNPLGAIVAALAIAGAVFAWDAARPLAAAVAAFAAAAPLAMVGAAGAAALLVELAFVLAVVGLAWKLPLPAETARRSLLLARAARGAQEAAANRRI